MNNTIPRSPNPDINYRLTKLEEFCLSLSAHFEGERVLRKEEDLKCQKLCDILSKQVIEIKETFPSDNFNQRFEIWKEQLINMMENRNKIEIINLNKKIDLIEKNANGRINEICEKLDDINKMQNHLNIFNNQINEKIKDINSKINMIDKEKETDINRVKNLETKVQNINLNYKENEEKNVIDLSNITENLSYLKDEFESFSRNYINEIEEIKINIKRQEEIKNKEMLNFEKHLLGEYDNFTKFMIDVLNKNVDKIKSMNEFMNSDVEIVKNKNKYIEETMLKLREDLFDSMDKNSKFILDKMKTHFNSQISNKAYNFENEKKNQNF